MNNSEQAYNLHSIRCDLGFSNLHDFWLDELRVDLSIEILSSLDSPSRLTR